MSEPNDTAPLGSYLRAMRNVLVGSTGVGSPTRSCESCDGQAWDGDGDPCDTCNGSGEIYDAAADAPFNVIDHKPGAPR